MKIKRPLHTPLGIRDLEYKASIKNTNVCHEASDTVSTIKLSLKYHF